MTYFRKFLLTVACFAMSHAAANAQCTSFQTVTFDGFEYTTVIPDIIPGTVVHNTPQTFGIHSGTRAMYLNMLDCSTGGTCAGDSIYIRTVNCCPTQPIRFRWWMETVFTGVLSDIRVVLTNGNDSVLAEVPSTVAPFGQWIEFTSPSVIPGTFTVKLKIYTNIDGQNGNDLGIDDMYIERCSNSTSTPVTACTGVNTLDLFNSVPNNPVNTGSWVGASTLANGYLGTYSTAVNTPGTYVYTSTPYGTSGLCMTVQNSIVVTTGVTPQPNLGNDTSVCINTPYLLNASATGVGLSYLWSNFATTSTITAFSGAVVQSTYAVTVSSTNGCTGRDSIHLSFQVCSGINEMDRSDEVTVYPNPAKEQLTIQLPEDINTTSTFILVAMDGKEVFRTTIAKHDTMQLPVLPAGIYLYSVINENNFMARGKISVHE